MTHKLALERWADVLSSTSCHKLPTNHRNDVRQSVRTAKHNAKNTNFIMDSAFDVAKLKTRKLKRRGIGVEQDDGDAQHTPTTTYSNVKIYEINPSTGPSDGCGLVICFLLVRRAKKWQLSRVEVIGWSPVEGVNIWFDKLCHNAACCCAVAFEEWGGE